MSSYSCPTYKVLTSRLLISGVPWTKLYHSWRILALYAVIWVSPITFMGETQIMASRARRILGGVHGDPSASGPMDYYMYHLTRRLIHHLHLHATQKQRTDIMVFSVSRHVQCDLLDVSAPLCFGWMMGPTSHLVFSTNLTRISFSMTEFDSYLESSKTGHQLDISRWVKSVMRVQLYGSVFIRVFTVTMVTVSIYIYITERSVRWYYGFSIATAAASARRPWRREHSNSINIQPISFKFYMRVDTPLRYFAIEIWYPPMTRTTAFAAKRHSYPPNLQNAISP